MHILITVYIGKYLNIISSTNPVLGCKKSLILSITKLYVNEPRLLKGKA